MVRADCGHCDRNRQPELADLSSYGSAGSFGAGYRYRAGRQPSHPGRVLASQVPLGNYRQKAGLALQWQKQEAIGLRHFV